MLIRNIAVTLYERFVSSIHLTFNPWSCNFTFSFLIPSSYSSLPPTLTPSYHSSFYPPSLPSTLSSSSSSPPFNLSHCTVYLLWLTNRTTGLKLPPNGSGSQTPHIWDCTTSDIVASEKVSNHSLKLDCFLDLTQSLDPIYIMTLPFMTTWSAYRPFTALHYATLHCTALHCTILHYTTLHCTAPHYTALEYTKPHCNTLYCTALHYTVMFYLSCLRCDILFCSYHMDTIRCRLMVQGVRRVKRWACGSLASILATTTMSCRTQWGKVTKVRQSERHYLHVYRYRSIDVYYSWSNDVQDRIGYSISRQDRLTITTLSSHHYSNLFCSTLSYPILSYPILSYPTLSF